MRTGVRRGAVDLKAALQLHAERAIDCDMESPFSRVSLNDDMEERPGEPIRDIPNVGLLRPLFIPKPDWLWEGDIIPGDVAARAGVAAPGEANLLLKGCTIARRVSASRCSSSSPQGARREPPRAMQDRRPTAAAEQTPTKKFGISLSRRFM